MTKVNSHDTCKSRSGADYVIAWPILAEGGLPIVLATTDPKISQTLSAKFNPAVPALFPLSWSHYVRLFTALDPEARRS
jgi:hypothetical protein